VLAAQPASLSFHFTDESGKDLDDQISARELSAFLTPQDGTTEIRMLKRDNLVKPHTYRLSVDVDGWNEARLPEQISLLPGQARTIPVQLEPHFYQRRWFLWTLAGVAAAATGLVIYTQVTRDPEHATVSGGNVGWTVEVR